MWKSRMWEGHGFSRADQTAKTWASAPEVKTLQAILKPALRRLTRNGRYFLPG
jgi:hypothetical protein